MSHETKTIEREPETAATRPASHESSGCHSGEREMDGQAAGAVRLRGELDAARRRAAFLFEAANTLARENARLHREAREAQRAKADFLAIMSHELRTPLNAIMGYTDLLEGQVSGPVTERQRSHLSRIGASARHLLCIIEQILSFARMESGEAEVSIESLRLAAIVAEVASLVKPLAAERSLDFETVIDDADAVLRTDAGKLRQILVSLLSNAVKFTDHGRVLLCARIEDGEAVFRVEDTGIGIAPALVERVFEPFWQAERPNTRRAGGSGLGLSVSRRFARLLRGDIAVASRPCAGSIFTVRIACDLAEGRASRASGPSGRSGDRAVS